MDKRLNVCFFNSCPTWGGGEKWHFDAATALDPERFQVVAAVQPGSVLQTKLRQAGVETFNFSIGNLSLLNPVRLLQLVRWFRRKRIDVVVLNLPSDLKIAGWAAKIAGVRRIIYRRGSAIPVRNTFLNRWLFAAIITDVLANSEETKKTVLDRNPSLIAPEKIRVIYNGIDLAPYTAGQEPQTNRDTGGELILGTAGRLSYQKNQSFLLEVAHALQQRKVRFRLLIAGTGPLREELLSRRQALGVEKEVEFIGFVEDIPSFMRQLDVFVLTSRWEGFGYVLAEAMASGKPVVAFANSSTPEVVLHKQTGLLTEENNLEEFCAAILSLAENPSLRLKLGENGRTRVAEMFDKQTQFKALAEYLLE